MKLGIIPKLIAGLIIGIIIGAIGYDWMIVITETFRVFLGDMIKFFIPLIIIAFVGAGIADFKGKIGKMLGFTVSLAYIDTIIAIALAAGAAYFVIPMLVSGASSATEAKDIAGPFMEIEIPQIMDILSALLLAFVLGIGSTLNKTDVVRDFVLQFRTIVMFAINKIILPILPFFIACTFAKLTAEGEIFGNIPTFAGMFALILVMQFIWLIIEYSLAGILFRNNPLTMMKAMIPAYITGVGTMSSAVTMPIALEQSKKVPYMNKKICDFVIPLCNTVHQAGAAIGITIGAMTVSLMATGEFPTLPTMIAFILLLGIIEVGAVGIPGGSIMAALGILQTTLGFDESLLALMITLFAIQDGFAAATNVTGDGALAMIVNKFFGKSESVAEDYDELEGETTT